MLAYRRQACAGKIPKTDRLRCVPFVLAALLTIGAFCQAQSQPGSIESISALIRAGQYSLAVQTADKVLQSTQGDPRLFTLKAIALSKLGQSTEALAGFQSALNINENYLPALAGAAELKYKLGSQDAVSYLDRLLKIRPQDQVAHAMRAVLAWKAGDCLTAVEHFSKAQDQIASQTTALQQFGACLVRLKRFDQATPVFRQLYQLAPRNPESLYALASVQLTNQDYKGAINTLEPSLREGTDARALQLASIAYEAMGDTPNAVSTLRKAILLDPNRPELYVDFSSISLDHKSYQVGIDMINAGLKRLPRSAKLYLARGVLYAQIGEYEKADRDFSTAALLDPNEAVASNAQALAELQNNKLEDARKTIENRLKQNPNDPFLYYLLAEVLTKNGAQPQSTEFAHAIAAAQRAVRLKPDFVLARNVLSRLYLDSGQVSAAIAQCRSVLAISPADQVALYRLIRALKAEDANRHREEISQLLDRLTNARLQARRREEEISRYRLVEVSPESPAAKP
jgi:tetratricopeptide (TPR) repeat protein